VGPEPSDVVRIPAPAVAAVDAAGAGDAAMAALIFAALARGGLPTTAGGWREWAELAVSVAAVVVQAPGGATAMPTLAEVRRQFFVIDP
jgi:fructokinase